MRDGQNTIVPCMIAIRRPGRTATARDSSQYPQTIFIELPLRSSAVNTDQYNSRSALFTWGCYWEGFFRCWCGVW